jgi:hypothetical protein
MRGDGQGRGGSSDGGGMRGASVGSNPSTPNECVLLMNTLFRFEGEGVIIIEKVV